MKTDNRESDSYDSPIVHEYGDIKECDNKLPRWWLYTLYGAIAFGACYWLYYHSFQKGMLPSEEYRAVKARELAAESERLKAAGDVTPELLLKLSKDPGTTDEGKAIFEQNCVTCHSDGGRGNIGPNLTDGYWIHGGDPKSIYTTVSQGVLVKQMPAWSKTLSEPKVRSVVSYVLTLKNTNVPGGKAPQGEPAP
jgi:cytochrome c oxidase cbb3-type subunit III